MSIVKIKQPKIKVEKNVRTIGVRSFIERISAIDKQILKNIRKSTDEDVQLVMDGLSYYTNYVNLDHPITARDIQTLVDAGLMTAEQGEQLKVDG